MKCGFEWNHTLGLRLLPAVCGAVSPLGNERCTKNISQGCGGWKQMAWAAGRLTALHVAFWSILRWERAEEESTKSTRRRKVRGLIFRTERLAATRWRHVWESAWIFFGLIRETNLGLIRSPFIIAASLHSHTYIQQQYGIMEGVHVQLPVRLP